jgi:uncharacterized protein (UPF0212 family)
MERTTYKCPVCRDNDNPVISTSLSMHKCPLCNRTFRNNDLIGYEITKGDFAVSWRDLHAIKKEIPQGSIIDGIKLNKDVDNQMEKMVQESTDNLLHEIIMMRIFNKKSKKTEKQVIKNEIDKIFDVILGRS